jgi:LemA protein
MQVIQARQIAQNASGVAATAQAENALTQTLRSLFAVAEAYPDLKANQTMLQLQQELSATENAIASARQYYNRAAMEFNVSVEQFPSNIVSRSFGFEPADLFEVTDVAERDVPQVKF